MDISENDFKAKMDSISAMIKDACLGKEDLISVLHYAQEMFGYIPKEVQVLVAKELDAPLSEVSGVVTFYSFFTTEPRGLFSISVCLGTACYVKGAKNIFDKFSSELEIALGETTEDRLFTLEGCRCIGACGLAPVVMVNEDVHGRLTEADVPRLIKEYMKKAQEV